MNFNLDKIKEIEANQLTGQELAVLRLNLTMTHAEISRAIGLSRQRVSDIVSAASKKLTWQGVK